MRIDYKVADVFIFGAFVMSKTFLRVSLLAVVSIFLSACGPSEEELALQDSVKKLEYEKQSITHQMETLRTRLRESVDQLEKAEQDAQSHLQSITQLQKANNQSDEHILLLKTEADSMQAEIAQQKEQIEGLNTQITEFQANHSTQQDEVAKSLEEVTKALKDKEAINAEKIAIADQLHAVNLEKNVLTEKLKLAQAENKMMENKLEQSAKALAKSKKDLADFQEERDRLYQKVSLTSGELNKIREKAAGLNSQYKSMLEQHSQLAKDDAAKRDELNNMRLTLEAAQSEVARFTGARGIYTIQSGDSLSTIAAFFYRDGNQWQNIWKANQYMLSKPDLIYEGMVLIVPQIEE